MRKEDLRINDIYTNRNGAFVKIKNIFGDSSTEQDIEDWDGNMHRSADLVPVAGKPYLSTDNYGHVSLKCETKVGTLECNFDTEAECGYSAAYIGFAPAFSEDNVYIDVARVKILEANNDLGVDIWENPYSEEPSYHVFLREDEIKDALS